MDSPHPTARIIRPLLMAPTSSESGALDDVQVPLSCPGDDDPGGSSGTRLCNIWGDHHPWDFRSWPSTLVRFWVPGTSLSKLTHRCTGFAVADWTSEPSQSCPRAFGTPMEVELFNGRLKNMCIWKLWGLLVIKLILYL